MRDMYTTDAHADIPSVSRGHVMANLEALRFPRGFITFMRAVYAHSVGD